MTLREQIITADIVQPSARDEEQHDDHMKPSARDAEQHDDYMQPSARDVEQHDDHMKPSARPLDQFDDHMKPSARDGKQHDDHLKPSAVTAKHDDKRVWHAMRATYRREVLAKDSLEQQGIECFIAMRKVVKTGHLNRRIVTMEPVVHNLLFARATREELRKAKAPLPYVQFMTSREGNKNVPIIVPDKQMNDFISVTQTYNDELMFLDPESIALNKGDKVRIHGGLFDGLEGVFMKVSGKRNKRVVIKIQNVIAVALAYVEPDFIEIIK